LGLELELELPALLVQVLLAQVVVKPRQKKALLLGQRESGWRL
jgi:hypothetical protein